MRLPGHVACPAALLVCILPASLAWGMDAGEVASAVAEGVAFALWPIIFVIVAALILYRYSLLTGGMETIKRMLTGASEDRRVLTLVLAWGFGGFLEGIAGFGTPGVIPGSVMIALGFPPLFAMTACLVANSAPTAFATLGVPTLTLSDVTGLGVMDVGGAAALQLMAPCVAVPFFLVIAAGGSPKAIKGVFLITLASGLSFALPILALMRFVGPELPTLIGSVCAISATIAANRLFYRDTEHNRKYRLRQEGGARLEPAPPASLPAGGTRPAEAFQAWLPFLMVLAVVVATSSLAPAVHAPLAALKSSVLIYSGEGGRPLTFSWLLTPGAMVLLSTLIACLIQRRRLSELAGIAAAALRQSKNPCITIVSIVAMAKVMNYSGMTADIATALIAVFGKAYPLAAPFVGAVGTFITGSDTTSCILFGNLQLGAAGTIGADPVWVTAANLSGATAGKMISPQSIAVAVAAGGMRGRDGELLRGALGYCAAYLAIVCAVTFAFCRFP
jgi:lactate permease